MSKIIIERGEIIGKPTVNIRYAEAGYIRLKKYSPRCSMVPRNEVLRYLRGEMMDPRTEGAEPKPK